MTFSTVFGKKARTLLGCLFALILLASLCLTAGATVKDEQTLLALDPNTLEDIQQGQKSFSLTLGDFVMVNNSNAQSLVTVSDDTYSGKAIRFTKGILRFDDTKQILDDYQTVVVGADLYFEQFPTGTREEFSQATGLTNILSCDPNTEHTFRSQSVLSWVGAVKSSTLFDGIRIDSEGNLYSGTDLASAIGVKLEKQTWYNLMLVYSKISNKTEIWVNGECVAAVNMRFRDRSSYFRLFDGSYSYEVYAKNFNISASKTVRYIGLGKEASADYISYQTTKPQNGSFKLRILAGVDSLQYNRFGYKVVRLTKDADGNTVSELLTGLDNKVYTSIRNGNSSCRIEERFGYPYAALATVEGLKEESEYTELVIYPYTVSLTGNKVYGTPVSLVYTGKKDAEGYPLFSSVKTTSTTHLPTDDTYISKLEKDAVKAKATKFYARNIISETQDGMYRAGYFKFTLPKEDVDRLDGLANAFLYVNTSYESQTGNRVKEPLVAYAASNDWEEETLTYNKYAAEGIAVRGEAVDTVDGEAVGGTIRFDVLDYLKAQAKANPNGDGSLTVSFCITQEDGHDNPLMVYLSSKESGQATRPYLSLEESLYGHSASNIKFNNIGYEPLSYAEKLVSDWFEKIYPKLYLDENGQPLYHDELGTFAPEGYATTVENGEGDFTYEIPWKNGSIWQSAPSKNPNSEFLMADSVWNAACFARTLSTLGTSTANAYLNSSYAKTITQYDSHGGITNLGFKGTATGYFHTEKNPKDGRTYIIDPLGNPYFAVSVNTVVYGDTQNQKDYSDAAYGGKEGFFAGISTSLRDIGINTVFVSGSDDLLALQDNGLAVTVGATGVGSYMGSLGRSQVSEGVYPNNNTINVFDPDFATYINQKNKELIEGKGYAAMKNLFGYTADNELPSGNNLLERYLTIDPAIPDNSFSYQTAWTWFAAKLAQKDPALGINPSLADLRALSPEEYAAYNSEFLSFVYATYYRTVRDSIKATDPNHMYIGSRVNGNCPYNEGYLRAAGEYLDMIAINLYDGLNPKATTLNSIYRYSGKPFIVTEFYAKGLDTIDANGLPLANSTGAGILVHTQKERAAYYEHYVLNLLESKACVGWVWYRFRDNDQNLYTVIGKDGTEYKNVKFLSMTYGEHPYPYSLMTEDGELHWLSEFYDGEPTLWADATTASGKKIFTKTYAGEALASNHNINKGLYNNNFSSVVTVYYYNKDGTLIRFPSGDDLFSFGSKSYEVQHPESAYLADGTILKSVDGEQIFMIGKQPTDLDDGSYTVTELTVYQGRYLAVTDTIKKVNDHLIGLIGYLDNN